MNLLWGECSCGNNVVTGKPELVENEAELKINKFFVGLYNNQYQVDGVIAYRAILQKLKSDGYKNIYSLYSDAPLLWRNAIEHAELIVKRGPPRCLEDICSARWLIFLIFEDLQEFFSYCREQL
ncbi:MAG: hypothetical protein AAAB16_10440, partial [Pseudomonas sp.]|uniref:hypothetical protein n=1 Tax=Pseudomonas sp. TaxID=306 RepID=UPI0030F07319